MEGEEEGQGGPKDLDKEGEREGDVDKNLPEDLVNQGGDQVDQEGQEGEKGTRLRGKSKAGLILEPLLDPLAAAVNRFDSVQLKLNNQHLGFHL